MAESGPGEVATPKKMYKQSSEEITARRLRLLYRVALNERMISNTIKDLAKDLEVSEDTLWNDWRRRRRWAPRLLAMDPKQSRDALISRFNKLSVATEALLALGIDSANVRARDRISALRGLTATCLKEIEVRQSLGYFPKVAEKIELTRGGEDIDKLLRDFKELEPVLTGEVKRVLSELTQDVGSGEQVHKDEAQPETGPVPPTV